MIRIQGLSRRSGGKTILESFDLEIRRGEIFTFIGPSGSGKTSVLRLIDLLDMPSTGTIIFDGIDTAASNEGVRLSIRRRMAMVFQKPAVLNTTVAANVAFGLKFRGIEKSDIDSRVHEALDIVGLAHLADRKAVTLSGGEMQRVAIARALITRPEVLLLDEPTANLDPVNTELIEKLILSIHRKFQTTIILSTHDMIQGQRLAERIGVIMDGRLVQVGTLHDIFYRPQGSDIARFVGIDTILKGVVESNEDGHAHISVSDSALEAITPCRPGTRVALFIRPEEISLALKDGDLPKSSVRNQLKGTITRMVPFGPFVRTTIDFGSPLTALVTRRSADELSLTVGSAVIAGVKATAIHVIPDQAG
jgi:tungstate transport system ATP-binding protein